MSAEQMSPEDSLIGQIMAANAAQAAHTTNLLLSYEQSLVCELAKTIVAIDEVLARATVIDRRTEEMLMRLSPKMNHAHQILRDREWAK